MLPMLGLYSELYRDRNGVAAEAYAVLEPVKEALYPKTFDYATYPQYIRKDEEFPAGPMTQPEERLLFGDLIAAVEYSVHLAEADEDAHIWRKRLPDLQPGTNAAGRLVSKRYGRQASGDHHAVPNRADKLRLRRLSTTGTDDGGSHRALHSGSHRILHRGASVITDDGSRHHVLMSDSARGGDGPPHPDALQPQLSLHSAASSTKRPNDRVRKSAAPSPPVGRRGLLQRASSYWSDSAVMLPQPPGDAGDGRVDPISPGDDAA